MCPPTGVPSTAARWSGEWSTTLSLQVNRLHNSLYLSAEPEKDYSSLINPRTKPSEVTSSAQGRQAKELRGQSTSKVMRGTWRR